MNRFALAAPALFGAVFGALVLTFAPFAEAQTSLTKQPPKLAPNPTETARIPTGIDTGTPMSSKTVPLGTPVPPNGAVDTTDLRTRSAAARAAARPDPATRKGTPLPAAPIVTDDVRRDAARPGPAAVADNRRPAANCSDARDGEYRIAMSRCTAISDRAARAACAEQAYAAQTRADAPVALPGSGFVGGSASPETTAGLARGAARAGCV